MAKPTINLCWRGIPGEIDRRQHEWLSDVPAALGACTSITLAMFAQRKGIPLTSIDVDLNVLQERPGQTEIGRDVSLSWALTKDQRTRLLESANACPIHKLLSGEVLITSQLVE